MENIIELNKVTKKFGGITALNKASLHVKKGEVVGLIGDNGAGKSTLIKTLVGVYSPDEGHILIRGKEINAWNALKAREAGIEGTVQVQFYVYKNGYVAQSADSIWTLRGIPNTGLDEAAIEAIKKTRWKPAKQRDKKVGVWIAVPINFKLTSG